MKGLRSKSLNSAYIVSGIVLSAFGCTTDIVSSKYSGYFISFLDPYFQPTVTDVNVTDTGGVNITWSHTGCFETFPSSTIVSYRTAGSTEWTEDVVTKGSSHVIDSILFPPNAVFQFKVNTRYNINDEVIVSDDSTIFNFTIPGEYCLFVIALYLLKLHPYTLCSKLI